MTEAARFCEDVVGLPGHSDNARIIEHRSSASDTEDGEKHAGDLEGAECAPCLHGLYFRQCVEQQDTEGESLLQLHIAFDRVLISSSPFDPSTSLRTGFAQDRLRSG